MVSDKSSSSALAPASGGTGGVSLVTDYASGSFLTGLAAASPESAAETQPAQPVSLVVVTLGALLGAALGGLALVVRRDI